MADINSDFDWLSDPTPLFAAQETWDQGAYDDMVCGHWSYRPAGPFSIACGIGLLAEHVRRFRFSPEVIQRLGRMPDTMGRSVFHESFLNYLQRLQLRIQVHAAPEGTLLLPSEPFLYVMGPRLQVQLMESAIRLLCWESSYWATQAAMIRRQNNDWKEEDTPPLAAFTANPKGWKMRALYIGGADPGDLKHFHAHPRAEHGDFQQMEHPSGNPLIQVRRLYKGNQPLGDVRLTGDQEAEASVSKTSIRFFNETTQEEQTVTFSRFQNLYVPALSKGHPVLPASRPGYFRQRTLKQLEAFNGILEGYGCGPYLR